MIPTYTYYDGQIREQIYLESCRTPVHELDTPLRLDGGDSMVDIFRYYVTSEIKDFVTFGKQRLPVEQTDSHVLAIARIALHHLVVRFEAHISDVVYGQSFMIRLKQNKEYKKKKTKRTFADEIKGEYVARGK